MAPGPPQDPVSVASRTAAREPWRFEGEAMASPLRLFVSGDPAYESRAAAAWDRVRATFEAAEHALSRFREDSDLTALNRRTGQEVPGASRMLVRALVAADRAHRRTGGRFDPRVLADLERLGLHGAAVSGGTASEATARPALVGPHAWRARKGPQDRPAGRILRRSGRSGTIRLDTPVDLGGIGKGLALRWAARLAEASLAPVLASGGGYLIDAGRDLTSGGAGPDGPWLVDVEDPGGLRGALAVIALPSGGAVATSSIRLRRWTEPGGRPVHHLVDPRTGEPGGQGLAAVTVAALDPAWAEIWSKALFLEGEAGIAAAARREGLAAWWATNEGRFEMTPAARTLTVWLADEAG
jgi:thiamine biosynthesis lipoprotein